MTDRMSRQRVERGEYHVIDTMQNTVTGSPKGSSNRGTSRGPKSRRARLMRSRIAELLTARSLHGVNDWAEEPRWDVTSASRALLAVISSATRCRGRMMWAWDTEATIPSSIFAANCFENGWENHFALVDTDYK